VAALTSLRDGSSAVIRALEPGDKQLVESIYRDMSDRSRRLRFLAPTRDLTEEDLSYLTQIDHNRHEAVVALDEETGRPLGIARYVRTPGDRESAEVAVVVIDDWHGRGLGTALLESLTASARERGIKRYNAVVSDDNDVVLRALERVGAEQRGPAENGEREFVFDLPGEGLGERLHDALRAAASVSPEFLAAIARRATAWRRLL
jgi:RimJ/RimL family protein N-acetyltransferase